jgi:hypothetical protein
VNGNRRRGGAKRAPKGAGHRCVMPPEPSASAPKCTVILKFLSHWDTSGCRPDLDRTKFAHYLVGEGKGEDGVLPEMFTADDDDVPKAFRDAWLRRDRSIDDRQPGFDGKRWTLRQAWCADILRREMPGEPRHFRLVVSPESTYGKLIDLKEFGRELLERVEVDNFRKLNWVASAHFNTPRPHLHFGIRGLDTEGKEVHFPSGYVRVGFKHRAREILHEAFGQKKRVSHAG